MPIERLVRHPLWPAGHLPLKGGDHAIAMLSSGPEVTEAAVTLKLPISPLEGEMAGRPEGGVVLVRLLIA